VIAMFKLLLNYFPAEARGVFPRLLEEVQRADMIEDLKSTRSSR
jgi:hypothetical protein